MDYLYSLISAQRIIEHKRLTRNDTTYGICNLNTIISLQLIGFSSMRVNNIRHHQPNTHYPIRVLNCFLISHPHIHKKQASTSGSDNVSWPVDPKQVFGS